LLTIWAGSLWTICGLVAPTLFAILDDRSLAGRIAATFFNAVTWIGLAIGVALLALIQLRRIQPIKRSRTLIVITAAAPLLSEVALGPLMVRARGSGNMAQFGMLHGVAALLFLVACLGALALIVKFNRPAE
jgi:hypothetical protein